MKTKKAMKKITHIGMAAIVAMGMLGTSCNKVESQEMETPETHKDNIVTLTTTVGFGEADTKALDINYTDKKLTKTFAAGEQVVLTYEDQDGNNQNTVSQALTAGDISADGKSAKLTFALTNPRADGYISYQYPASESNFYAQNGTLTDVATRDYAAYDGSFAGTNLPTSATLDNEIAVVAFTLYKSDGTTDITNTITCMTIEVSGVTYTITPSGLDKIYVAMWPEDGSEITITATDGSKNYTKTLTGKTYEAGEFYQQGLKMAEAAAYKLLSAATAEDIGKVVCAAGHLHEAKTAVPAICTAVGILGKVTETGHGLILALQDATSQNWNTINGWTSVTTYAGTTLKVLPDDAARGANLTSYTALGTTAVSNWAVAQKSDYEAIFQNLGSTINDDGYTYDGNVNAYITTGVGGTALDYIYWYWSATEYNDERGWVLKSNYWDDRPKDNWFRVRPVLAFYPFNHLPIYY